MAHSSSEVQNEDNCKMDEDLKHSMVLWKEYELLSHVDLDLNSVSVTSYLCDLGQFY